MSEEPKSFWAKLAAITAFLAALGTVGALITKFTEKESTSVRPSEEQLTRYLPSKTVSVSGTYNGTVFNQTYGRSGKLRLVINSDSVGKVTGTVTITGGLSGSGPLEGHTDGHSIGFTSVEPSTGVLITWEGVIQGSSISGDYTVPVPLAIRSMNPTLPDEEGVWKVSR
jgi:hypothetical protein